MTISTVLRAIAASTIVAGSLTLGIAEQARSLTIIDTSTSPTWDGIQGYIDFGQGSTPSRNPSFATFGQTFTLPVNGDTVLSSFTFFVGKQTVQGSNPVEFNAYVMAWDGSRATGSILYQSDKQVASTVGKYQPFDFMTGGLSLLGGQQYVAFISTSNYQTSGLGIVGTPTTPSNPYSDGDFVYLSNGTDFNAITTSDWGTIANSDLAFKATFTSIPTPSLVPAILGIGTALLRRRKSELVEESNEE
jgi:hypothetical protein